MKIFISLICLVTLAFSSVYAQGTTTEMSPFTKIEFGYIPVRGDYIKVENPDFIEEGKTHFLIEVNGLDYKEILKKTKKNHGKKNFKCRLAEHFIATMGELGVKIVDNKVNLKLYQFSFSHKVFEIKDVPLTLENLDDIKFETNHCEP